MLTVEHEYVVTEQIGNRGGVRMKSALYQAIQDRILAVLTENQNLNVASVIERIQSEFVHELGDNTGYFIYQVKLDMEAKGMIKHLKESKGKLTVTTQSPADLSELREATLSESIDRSLISVKSKFDELFKVNPMVIHSPGRINLIGEHTDYNNGYVMPAAIDKGVRFAIAPSSSRHSLIYSMKYDQFLSVDLEKVDKVVSPAWSNYLLGVVYQVKARGLSLGNFNCVFDGDLPSGAGLSSSAAMECGFVFGLNELFGLKLSRFDMIHIAQWAEHNYVGVKCGIMDQFSSMMGKPNHVMVLDCQWLTHTYFPLDLGDYQLILCDTNVKHSLSSSEYNIRRQECEEAVRILRSIYPEISSLRDVNKKMLVSNKSLLSSTLFNRSLYVVEENDRVLKGSIDLKKGRLSEFGKKMFASHAGLSLLYQVSCPELDFLVSKAKEIEGVLGARMMGGGFGGCTINIIHKEVVEIFTDNLKSAYRERFGIEMTTHQVNIGGGTSVVQSL